MRETATYRVIFNRKKIDLNPNDSSLIQVEIRLTNGIRKYIGVTKVMKCEWDDKKSEVVNTPLAGRINNQVQDVIRKIRAHEATILDQGFQLTIGDIETAMGNKKAFRKSFVQFMRSEINKRNDIHVKTRSRHLLMADTLESLGIINFSDLTYANIMKLDQWLKDQGKEQTTIHKKHQFFNQYIHVAEKIGLFDPSKNPYNNFENKRGTAKIRIRLDDSEIDKICQKEIFEPNLQLCRDLYVFQMFTGLSYTDVQAITYSGNVSYQDDGAWITGLRRKDAVYYSVPLVKEAEEIMQHYRVEGCDQVFKAPVIKTQNENLRIVADLCGIKKHLTTHTARHTSATLMLRKGMPLEYVSNVLGHNNIETTKIYAKLERENIRKFMMNISGKKENP